MPRERFTDLVNLAALRAMTLPKCPACNMPYNVLGCGCDEHRAEPGKLAVCDNPACLEVLRWRGDIGGFDLVSDDEYVELATRDILRIERLREASGRGLQGFSFERCVRERCHEIFVAANVYPPEQDPQRGAVAIHRLEGDAK